MICNEGAIPFALSRDPQDGSVQQTSQILWRFEGRQRRTESRPGPASYEFNFVTDEIDSTVARQYTVSSRRNGGLMQKRMYNLAARNNSTLHSITPMVIVIQPPWSLSVMTVLGGE